MRRILNTITKQQIQVQIEGLRLTYPRTVYFTGLTGGAATRDVSMVPNGYDQNKQPVSGPVMIGEVTLTRPYEWDLDPILAAEFTDWCVTRDGYYTIIAQPISSCGVITPIGPPVIYLDCVPKEDTTLEVDANAAADANISTYIFQPTRRKTQLT